MQRLVHFGELARDDERPVPEDRDRESQRLGDPHRGFEEGDGPILAQRLLEDAYRACPRCVAESRESRTRSRESHWSQRGGERRRAGDRRHAVAAIQRRADKERAGVTQCRSARIGAQRERLASLEPFDQLRNATALIERGQREHGLVHAVRRQQCLGATRVLGDHRVALAQHAQRAQRDVLEVADRGRDNREGPGQIAHRPQSRG